MYIKKQKFFFTKFLACMEYMQDLKETREPCNASPGFGAPHSSPGISSRRSECERVRRGVLAPWLQLLLFPESMEKKAKLCLTGPLTKWCHMSYQQLTSKWLFQGSFSQFPRLFLLGCFRGVTIFIQVWSIAYLTRCECAWFSLWDNKKMQKRPGRH